VTQLQINEFNNQESIAREIQTGAGDFSYISNSYFLYQSNSSISLWQTKSQIISDKIAALNSTDPLRRSLVGKVSDDLENLNTVFVGVTSFISNSRENVSTSVSQSFQIQWNRLAVQIQALAFDSQQLSQAVGDQTSQVLFINTVLTIVFMVCFGAFFVISFLITYRGILGSISKLKNGIRVIGSGNLDYDIEAGRNNEVADISESVNAMATNLKSVTASKADLEREIEERKKIAEALSESQKKYQALIETTGEFIWEMDAQGRYTYCSPQMEKLWGLRPEDMVGKTPFDVMPAGDKEKAMEYFMKVGSAPKQFKGLETTAYDSQGHVVFIETSGTPFFDENGKLLGFRGISRDITERKKAEKEIENLAKFPLENPAGVLRVDQKGIVMFANPSAEHFLKEWQIEVGGEIPERIRKMVTEALDSNKKMEFEENLGEEIFSFIVAPIVPEGYANLYGRSITKRKKAEAKLEEYTKHLEELVRERTEKLELNVQYTRSLIEASLDPLVTISAEGRITDLNKAAEEATGCSRQELIGTDFSSYFTEPEKAREAYTKMFTEGFVVNYPLALKHRSGRVMDVLYNASVYRNTDGQVQGVFAAARDVTERKNLEKQLQERERLAAIGSTAGMVGHDIRNPLQAILGDLYLAKDEIKSIRSGSAKKNLNESINAIEENIVYINKIISDLQDYTKPLHPSFQEFDLKRVICDIQLHSKVPENIKASSIVDADVKKLNSDQTIVKRIIENLILNAIQAMPNGGRLTVKARKEQGDSVITVEDTGGGIPENVRPKLFTPLFTTKSKGQGFGLAVVKRMTEALEGTVTFETEVGKGTMFIVRLPQATEKHE